MFVIGVGYSVTLRTIIRTIKAAKALAEWGKLPDAGASIAIALEERQR